MNNFFTNKFRDLLTEFYSDTTNEYTLIDWGLINGVVDEIKNNLYQLSADSNRVLYLKTVLNSFCADGLEGWFSDISKEFEYRNGSIYYVGDENNDTRPIPTRQIIAILKFIKWRNDIIFMISEQVANIYPGIAFRDVMSNVNIKTQRVFWLGNAFPVDFKSNNNLENAFIGGISAKKIAAIYELCIDDGLFKNPFSYTDFINCFDLNKVVKDYPVFNPQIKFVFIVSKIDGFNNKIGKERFLIGNFNTVKNRLKKGNNFTVEFKNNVKKIVNT